MATKIVGCWEIQTDIIHDKRGFFVKTFHQHRFEVLGLETSFPEEFHSYSKKSVLRGLHFVAPPLDQVKVVSCLHGSILDTVVDLRRNSPTFGAHIIRNLSAETATMLYIGRGLAHGFLVLSDDAVVCYRVSTMYSLEHDKGVRWDSVGIDWPTTSPIVSERDASFPAFSDFKTPFQFREGAR